MNAQKFLSFEQATSVISSVGHLRTVLVSGENGIGKTSIYYALQKLPQFANHIFPGIIDCQQLADGSIWMPTIDTELAGLGPEQLQAPIETCRKAVAADALPEDGTLPVRKADVIEYDTELLREEITTRYSDGLSIEQALRRQRGSHAQALLLMLPSLANWSRDPQLSGQGRGFTAALERG